MVSWEKLKVVIFDVDGTLYLQSKLRKKVLLGLLRHYSVRPWKIDDLKVLMYFRKERERNAGYMGSGLELAQYIWCAERVNYPVSMIKPVIERWIFDFPNQYLADCVFPGIHELFGALREHGIKIAIYSDYKAQDKLKAMGLEVDMSVASTDPEVDRLKPDPCGLLYITEKMGVDPDECLFIGDRLELDGECAIRAGMPYLIIDKKPIKTFDFFHNLTSQLNAYSQTQHIKL
ncbi:phosphoglycolate phosphatase/putative hydrolase of the HAD superfamily [Arcticibacter pallidicorallinus]|uniref:phosphoglycolate phosphatase n=1 Tax=Arcticibacter pallidicorallinus TaxID=1259464 RepID=A0A2T0TR90_9SPHI|nr:HAD family hydrolase [Arcticibacter pallidicorallinus]PRY48028.1 phosphoglycolate phosphatase/putative hydrolase of the HAD superfamily [Arcticibacter pallidicorallinus]